MSDTAAEMPRYQCHKQVWALKIASVQAHVKSPVVYDDGRGGIEVRGEDTGGTIVPAEDGYAPFSVSAEYMRKHNPQPGGYYVVYDDGYASWSPAEAFESGYTRIR